jgi:ribonuclease Z
VAALAVQLGLSGEEVLVEIIVLGSSSAVSSSERDNTSLAVVVGEEIIVIDCSAGPVRKLLQAGKDFRKVSRILVTHTHTDHIYGIPSLIHELLLEGREDSLEVHCPRGACSLLSSLLEMYFGSEEGMFPVTLVPHNPDGVDVLLEAEPFVLSACPITHGDGALAYRIDTPDGASAAYSGDTGPSELLIALSRDVDLLVHESTFPSSLEDMAVARDHSTPRIAGRAARDSGAKTLLLVHMEPTYADSFGEMVRDAEGVFPGRVELGRDGMIITLDGDSAARVAE